MNFNDKVSALIKQIEEIKYEFSKYIADTSIPLEERWEVFMKAPEVLHNKDIWKTRFKGVPSDFVGNDGPLYAERHMEVDIQQYMEVLENPDDYNYDPSDVDIVAFKEDVLSRNIYSYTFDW